MNEVDLKKFETLKLRNPTIDDFDALVSLQVRCFPGMKTVAQRSHHVRRKRRVSSVPMRRVANVANPR